MPEGIRSFISFDINDDLVLKRLSEIQSMLVNTGANLKVVKPQNIHITMKFLGNIHEGLIDAIYEEIKKISFTPFDVELKSLGAFPSLRYPRVVWVGIMRGADQLRNVFSQLDSRLAGLGFNPDSRGFSPHLTIARVRTGKHKGELIRCVEELADYDFGTFIADYLRLKKSVLTPKGPIYTTMREFRGS